MESACFDTTILQYYQTGYSCIGGDTLVADRLPLGWTVSNIGKQEEKENASRVLALQKDL